MVTLASTEGTSQRTPPESATRRKDYYDCFLADQPSYLVPLRLLPKDLDSSPSGRLLVNPHVGFSWRDELPKAIAACGPLPDKFFANAGFAWVCDPRANTQTPFWAGPWFQGQIAGLRPGEPEPADLPRRFRSVLLCAGVLVTPGGESRAAKKTQEELVRSSQLFHEHGYVALSGLIHPFHIGSLRRYYRHLLRTGGMKLGDSGSPLRHVAHNESVARFFHRQLASVVSAVVGVPVKPSYVYASSYQSGAELPVHTDREQCEYSITLLLDHTPEPVVQAPWPLILQTSKGPVQVWQGLGDGLLYRGRQLPHYRTTLPAGMNSTSLFFHYVDRDFAGSLS